MDEDNTPVSNVLLPNLGYVYIYNDYDDYDVLTIYFSKDDFIKDHANDFSATEVNKYRYILRDIDDVYTYQASKSWAHIWYDTENSNC